MMIRVILADDHQIMRDGLRAILERQEDMDVIADVSDGWQALDVTKRLRPDIILMDINMPLLNGIEAARKICEMTPDTRVIILSMHVNKELIYQALTAGAKGYLLKETSASEVVDAIWAVNAGRRYLSSKIEDTVVDEYIHQRSRPHKASPLQSLSGRERQVLQLVVDGKSSSEIAELLHLSASSVNTYRSRLMKKLGVSDVPALVKFAIGQKLI